MCRPEEADMLESKSMQLNARLKLRLYECLLHLTRQMLRGAEAREKQIMEEDEYLAIASRMEVGCRCVRPCIASCRSSIPHTSSPPPNSAPLPSA